MEEHRPSEEVIRHYRDEIDEGQRLMRGLGQLELLRTREIVRRHLPDGPLRVLNVGGATGVHAARLAEDGHQVHVVDPVAAQVARALESPGARAGRITAEVGDTRRLAASEASFDAVLLLGPLYHLTRRDDRLTALAEARRVVRPGAPVFAAAISRFASLFDGLARGLPVRARLRRHRRARPARRPAPQPDRPSPLVHDGLLPPSRRTGGGTPGVRLPRP